MVRKLLTGAAVAAAFVAGAAYPPSAAGYSFINVSGIPVTGNPLPLRSGDSKRILKAEDVACLAEMACERDAWLNITNAPAEAGLTTAPTCVLASNIISAVNFFVTERGNSMHSGAEGAHSDDNKRMFVDTGWESSMSDNIPEDTGTGWSWWYYGLGAIVGHVRPQRVEQSAAVTAWPTVSGVQSLYDNVSDRTRLFGGWVSLYGENRDYGFGTGWTALHIGYLKAGSSYVYHGYNMSKQDSQGYHSTPTTETRDGFQFQRYRTIRGQGHPDYPHLITGACSPFGWSTTSVAPYVVINPVFYGKVKSATLYAVICCEKYLDFDYPDYVAHTTYQLAVVRVPLVKNGSEVLYGKSCEKWKLPDSWKDSRQVIDMVLYDLYGATSSGGFPTISGASLFGGALDLELTPRYGPSTGD